MKENKAPIYDGAAIINAVLQYAGLKAPSFAKKIGTTYQRIFDLQKGRTTRIGPDTIKLIVKAYPEINQNYLYTGEGDLLLPPTKEEEIDSPEIVNLSKQLLDLYQRLVERGEKMDKRAEILDERASSLDEREQSIAMREQIVSEREAEVARREAELGLKKEAVSA